MTMFELRDRIASIPTLKKRLNALEEEIQKAEHTTAMLLRRYEFESGDVSRLTEGSFTAFFYALVGKYEEKLEKEQSEEIQAKIAYDRAVARLNGLVRDKEELHARILALVEDKKKYEAELESLRRDAPTRLPERERGFYAQLSEARIALISRMTEIKEALAMLRRAQDSAMRVWESLSHAKGWSAYDVFGGGGFLTHRAKYGYIDVAEENFNILSYDLRALESELRDVEGVSIPGFTEISYAQCLVDYWFDNIFTDLSVHDKIAENVVEIRKLIESLNDIEATIKEQFHDVGIALAKNKEREEELLLSLSLD